MSYVISRGRGVALYAPRGGATCAPACTADVDCDGIAANGACAAGVCTWSALEMCRAEPGGFSCFLCCLGQATGADFEPGDFATCSAACIPSAGVANARLSFPVFPDVALPGPIP